MSAPLLQNAAGSGLDAGPVRTEPANHVGAHRRGGGGAEGGES